ncbi:hypothetical protein HPB47_011127 [Ixodes persulcatus]|uniref:Uncharacterized protein n=1 Tax=Ixodes persulcatus TaxID=34615 RepID=A0AC60NX53_IXOPE|nr:hypothetical protein HPB47_011127 [Ixodes persulcatus]
MGHTYLPRRRALLRFQVNDEQPLKDNGHVKKTLPQGAETPATGAAAPRLLAQPRWEPIRAAPLSFRTTAELTTFLGQLEGIVRAELTSRRYNTLGNLLHFYAAYRRAGPGTDLADFYRAYEARVVEDGLSCVGLSLHLAREIRRAFAGASPFLVSCEEWIPDVEAYCRSDPPDASSVKEHVLVALRVLGYHVGFPVAVMDDGRPPHRGHFVQSNTAKSVKEYSYEAMGSRYVRWRVRETRAGCIKQWDNVLYVGGAFQSALAYSEKRNLLYDFRTLVARDGTGPSAGVYCKLNEVNRNPVFTLFYAKEGSRAEVKLPFYLFASATKRSPEVEAATKVAAECAAEVGVSAGELLKTLRGVADLYEDVDFVNGLLDLNRRVDPFDA